MTAGAQVHTPEQEGASSTSLEVLFIVGFEAQVNIGIAFIGLQQDNTRHL